jgi:predicted dehydrogenase
MRVVILGLGVASHKILIPAVREKAGLSIEATCDPDERARARAASAGLRAFATAREAIDAGRPDLVLVATPPDTHRELCVMALEAGAHVLCEKPFVPSLADADAVLDAARRAGRQVAVNNQYYLMPVFVAMRRALGDGSLGDLLFLSCWQTTLEPPARATGWRGALRRRTLFEFGTHAVDLIIHFFGERPHAVTAATSSDGGDREWDAFASATLHFSRGRIASLVTDRVSRGRWRYLDFRAETSKATLRASLGGEARVTGGIDGLARVPFLSMQLTQGGLAWIETGERRKVIAKNPPQPYTRAACGHLSAFVDAVREGRPFARNAAENRAAIETVIAAYLSADLGRRIDLDADAALIARETLA